ncbi:MAG: RNA-binding S4 domain-containing protein [Clostridiaceae bacterium]|nr:RNA-binding S4 domain-containing protein [Clostridiaceae bacterium]
MRIDKFLKVARLVKRRTVANEICSLGKVTINGRVVKPSSEVKEGDIVEIHFANKSTRVEVVSVAENASKAEAAKMIKIIG